MSRALTLAGSLVWLLPALAALAADLDAFPAAGRKVDYEREVQPLLAQRCGKCHGDEKRESGFRVDRREMLLTGGDSGEPAIAPGKSAESRLIQRVAGIDKDLVMPPKGDRLSAAEVGILRAWIDAGAAMPEPAEKPLATSHWSLQPLARPRLPAIAEDAWSRGPIDRFVLAKLREQDLVPSSPADRRTLIRRLYLDLLGLAPTPEEIERFAADDLPLAYERLVEQVLASPHYGERWARHWLDVVRFAESNGFETNVERPNAYRYRDWVIAALNRDLPYDRFVTAQLAGDRAAQDGSLDDAATGFLVAGATDIVKSPDPLLTAMQRQDELTDMVNTTGTAFLGLTLGCARCHTHKFDPILQKDFYALQAIFAGVEHGERPLASPGNADRERKAAELAARVARLQAEFVKLVAAADGAGDKPRLLPAVNAKHNVERFPQVVARAVRFTIKATNSAEPCLDELEVFTPGEQPRNIALASAGAKATSSGDYAGNPKHRLEHIHDGRYSNDFSWISNTAGRGWVRIDFAEPAAIDRIEWGRDRQVQYRDRLATQYVIEVLTGDVGAEAWQVVASSERRAPFDAAASGTAAAALAGLPAADAAKGRALLAEVEALERARAALVQRPMAYAGRFVTPPATYRLHRGEALAKREVVEPETLSALQARVGSLELKPQASDQDRRAALAQWIVSPANPLTARVIVNRLWHYHFGRGIVATPSDFGAMGRRPTHPELLDWLATELIESGWSLKGLHRQILLSATYRQASEPRADGLARDKESTLLWRFPPRRLEAEAVRDNILAVSGSLDTRPGGPGFLLYLPNANYSRNWVPKEDFGPEDFRRMIYATQLRMKRDSVFGAFDCPDGGQIAPSRTRSTTPIQALSLFNSRFLLQQADAFAARVRREAGDEPRRQVERAFALAFGRSPDADESAAAQQLVREQGLPELCRALLNASEFLWLP